jgi:GNAT superfamily N-acetyltransferase
MALVVRRLAGPEDRAALDAFLLEHADASLFLRSNVWTSGLVDGDAPYAGSYAGAFEDGRIVGAAAHYWNGNVILQAPRATGEVARAACAPGRRVTGFLGPWAQVVAARAALRLADEPTRLVSRELLMTLDLGALHGAARRRRAPRLSPDARRDLISIAWRVAYMVEELKAPEDDATRALADADVRRIHAAGIAWLLEERGTPVAFSGFNAQLPDVVQIGGVFTPPALRRRGYGRAVVAGSLRDARAAGVQRSVLFTGDENVGAVRAYEAIGYRPVGDYGIVTFHAATT